jgi:hypothetical protein
MIGSGSIFLAERLFHLLSLLNILEWSEDCEGREEAGLKVTDFEGGLSCFYGLSVFISLIFAMYPSWKSSLPSLPSLAYSEIVVLKLNSTP